MYTHIFDHQSCYWQNNPTMNIITLQMAQTQANFKVRARGFIFLNEVHEMLGLSWTSQGQLVGWIFDPNDESNFIDFGINPTPEDLEINAFRLEFNVDGVIYDKIEELH